MNYGAKALISRGLTLIEFSQVLGHPTCKLQLPVGLYGDTESIEFISNSEYISFKNCIRINKDTWNVKQGAMNLEGNINLEDVGFSFNYPINRVKLVADNNLKLKYSFINDVYEDLLLSVYCIPEIKVGLFIFNGHCMQSLLESYNTKQNGNMIFIYLT